MLSFNYRRAMLLASDLRTIGNNIRATSNGKVAIITNDVQGSWKGQSGQKYIVKCEKIKTRIDTESSNIFKVAESLEDTARWIDRMEREASRLLSSR